MPDWLTHAVIGMIIIELFNVKKKSLVLLGTILPDLLPKLVLLRLIIPIPSIDYNVLSAFHTPFILFLFTLILALFFQYDYKKTIFWLNLGTLSHFLSDSLLKHFIGGVNLFYPLSLRHYTFNLVWPDQSYLIFLTALILYLMIILVKRYYHQNIYSLPLFENKQ